VQEFLFGNQVTRKELLTGHRLHPYESESLTLLVPDYIVKEDLDVSSFEKSQYLEVDEILLPYQNGQGHIHQHLLRSIKQLIIRRTTIWIKPYLESFLNTFVPNSKYPDFGLLKLHALEEEHSELKKEATNTRARQRGVASKFEKEPANNH
jgi:hypothetical protein